MIEETESGVPHSLCIIWTSRDPDVARQVVFMYGGRSLPRGWWDSVFLVAWGPSQKLLMEDAGLQQELSDIMERGVRVLACRACAEAYGLETQLEALGIEVEYTGAFLTNALQDDSWRCITF